MSGAAFLRVKRLKGGGIINVAARHNRRVIQAEIGASGSIDPTRSNLNETLMGAATADDVGQLAKELMTAAGVGKLRKDAITGIEIVVSLPADHGLDDRAYFLDCCSWTSVWFEGSPILSADIHRDEAQTHCHILLLPLVNNRMVGSDLHGGKRKLIAMQSDFHLKVAARYGLRKAPARLQGPQKAAAAAKVLLALRERSDPVLSSLVWATVRESIERDPAPFLLSLGLDQPERPAKKMRTFTQIMTSKGKGRAREDTNPIGFVPPAKKQTLCSVGFTPEQPLPTAQPVPPEVPFVESIRVRDSDLDPTQFDPDTGEYFQRPPPVRLQRAAADAWVRDRINK